ncbi:Hsp20/alpha crystallin family protein [Zhouia spongiae]|uniref:Hsp20/alpha crystallin family protein n=1 Tax=Zhouia spongiae TaxID=2202721 RepID=A0ABY3YI75_9FLAO|nr:Hsp20/alpha crystallin family protein [Zhouia spongiae]UNY97559.1 Hsp20/alpha crystallin family protein [Zhouia spongiae]
MNLVKRNPNVLFPSFIDELFNNDWYGGKEVRNFNAPAVNIKENDDSYSLELAAPGLKKEDINVSVDENILSISSEVKTEKEETQEGGRYTRKEFNYSSFRRSFTLPETANEDQIDASYADGVLKVTIPKKEEALPKQKRMISIS